MPAGMPQARKEVTWGRVDVSEVENGLSILNFQMKKLLKVEKFSWETKSCVTIMELLWLKLATYIAMPICVGLQVISSSKRGLVLSDVDSLHLFENSCQIRKGMLLYTCSVKNEFQ